MIIGNEIDHLADKAMRTGFADAMWLSLRNAYFRHGTQEDGWDAMVQCFKDRGVRAESDWRSAQPRPVEWVVLRPAHGATRSQE